MQTPKITFVVASFNYGKFLSSNLDSLCSQWREDLPFYILVVEDGSSDNSVSIVEDYVRRFSFIRAVTHKNHANLGLVESLKLATREVSTEWISFLESDDISNPESVKEMVKAIKEGNSGLIFFDVEPLIEEGANQGWFNAYVPRIRDFMISKGANVKGLAVDKEILLENIIPTFSCVLVKRNLLADCSFNSPVHGWLDWYLWIQIAQRTNVRFIDRKLVRWRIHLDSQNNKKKFFTYLWQYVTFRSSVRRRLSEMAVKNKFSKMLFLSLPVAFPLGIRFLRMVRYAGIRKVLGQIYGRFN